MKFNWIFSNNADKNLQKQSVELEYRLRPKITKFLMEHLEQECCGDFSCFYFDVDMKTQRVLLSEKTPKNFFDKIKNEFDFQINRPQNLSSAS